MTSRILIENGVLTARLDDESERESESDRHLSGHVTGHVTGHPKNNLPKPTMQKQYTSRRVDDIKMRFEKILSEYNDHQRLLSRYKEQKQQLGATNYSENQQQHMVHNATSVTPTDYSLREGQIINPGNRLETDDSTPTDVDKPKHPQEQHSDSCVSEIPPPTTTTTKPDIDETDCSRADFFRRKIQQFDKVINSCSTPESPKERKKCNDDDAPPRSLEKVNNNQDEYTASFLYLLDQHAKQNKAKTTVPTSPLAANKSPRKNLAAVHEPSSQRDNRRITGNCLRINSAGEVVITTNNSARISSRGFPAIQQGVVDPAAASTNFGVSKQHQNDPPRLNETMSTCSSGSKSSREVPMGGMPSDETDSESAPPGSRCTPTIKKTMVNRYHRTFCLRRLCLASGIIVVSIALFGVGILFGYLSYTNTTKQQQ
jgi:hypothetical protein